MYSTTVACVADQNGPFLNEAVELFASLRAFGGNARDADCIVHVVGPVSAVKANSFIELGVSIDIVKPVFAGAPHANKLSMLVTHPSDTLLCLDTDVLCVGDPSEFLSNHSLSAKVVDQDPIGIALWQKIFDHFGVRMPNHRMLTSFHFLETIPYFNSGVIAVPMTAAASLREVWFNYIHQFEGLVASVPEVQSHKFFLDQISLCLAIQSMNLCYRELPLEMNYPTHHSVHPIFDPDRVDPILLHHHHRKDSEGSVLRTGAALVDRSIERVSDLLKAPVERYVRAAQNDTSFNNRDFWDHRYQTNLSLGSGVGSRGQHAIDKRTLVADVIASCQPTSVLDVGCGDMEVLAPLQLGDLYVGLDISEAIVTLNQQRFPQSRFEVMDFAVDENAGSISADLVLCFDVLIHQHRYSDYQTLVRRLVGATRKVGLVSGYLMPPRAAFSSAIVAYHECLSLTLERYGARNIRIVSFYRDTNVLMFDTELR